MNPSTTVFFIRHLKHLFIIFVNVVALDLSYSKTTFIFDNYNNIFFFPHLITIAHLSIDIAHMLSGFSLVRHMKLKKKKLFIYFIVVFLK